MSWLDDFKADVGEFALIKVAAKTSAPTKSPRQHVITLIDNSLLFLTDNNYKLKTGKRAGKAPDLCYKVKGADAEITLTYSREKIMLQDENPTISLKVDKLGTALRSLRKAVDAGVFDAALNKIKQGRSEAQKAARAKTAASKKAA